MYKQLRMFKQLHSDYIDRGHHSNTVYLHKDPDAFSRAIRSTYDPLFYCPPKEIEETYLDPQFIQSPRTYLEYNLEQLKLKDEDYIHVTYTTPFHGRKKIMFHPTYGTTKSVDSGVTYQTLKVGHFTTTLPLVNIHDGTDKKYMVLSSEEATALISEYIYFEIVPEIARLPLTYYAIYDKLNHKHSKVFVSAYCKQLEREAKAEKERRDVAHSAKYCI